MDGLTPDTSIALMSAAQNDLGRITGKLNNPAKSSLSNAETEKIAAAAEEFEAVFISEMVKPMFEGISTEAPFGGGKGEEVFRSMLVQEYGKILARTGGVGIKEHVKEQMIYMQETANNATNIPSK